MSTKFEYERRFKDFDFHDVYLRARDLGSPAIPVRTLLINTVYKNDTDLYIRIRDVIYVDGRKESYLTFKKKGARFEEEYEALITDMPACLLMLDLMKCRISYVIEKFRDVLEVPGYGELDFDTAPGLPPFLEVECYTEDKLNDLIQLLGLGEPEYNLCITDLYAEHYGITKKRHITGNLTFETPSNIEDYITKNRHIFHGRLRQHRHKAKRFLNAASLNLL